jgi:hypothetical protein
MNPVIQLTACAALALSLGACSETPAPAQQHVEAAGQDTGKAPVKNQSEPETIIFPKVSKINSSSENSWRHPGGFGGRSRYTRGFDD